MGVVVEKECREAVVEALTPGDAARADRGVAPVLGGGLAKDALNNFPFGYLLFICYNRQEVSYEERT